MMFISVSLLSCDVGGDPDPGATEVVDLAGDWYVMLLVDGEDIYGLGYNLISTYNTASDDEEMWVDDHELWPMKVVTPVNVESLTFSGTDLENLYSYEDSEGETVSPVVDITNGKVLLNAATTSGGNTTDSIHMNVEFSDDPGTVYTLAGYRRTGFLEDEH